MGLTICIKKWCLSDLDFLYPGHFPVHVFMGNTIECQIQTKCMAFYVGLVFGKSSGFSIFLYICILYSIIIIMYYVKVYFIMQFPTRYWLSHHFDLLWKLANLKNNPKHMPRLVLNTINMQLSIKRFGLQSLTRIAWMGGLQNLTSRTVSSWISWSHQRFALHIMMDLPGLAS